MPEQLKLVRELVAWAEELLALGYKTQMGNCRVQHRGGKKRRFTLNLITFLPKDHPGGEYTGVFLPDYLETWPEDRPKLPSYFGAVTDA